MKKNDHSCVKPVKLFAYLITMATRPGDLVCDPYMGSGTTGVAAALLDRDFIGIEIDKKYVKMAKKRIKNYEEYTRFIIEKPKENKFSGNRKPVEDQFEKQHRINKKMKGAALKNNGKGQKRFC